MIYAEVILPLALNKNLTYIVPDELKDRVGVGYRVVVPLGKRNKFYTGIVVSLSSSYTGGDFELKEIEDVLDSYPIVIHPQIKLWKWISDYYICSEGEVMKAALPSALKLESETAVQPTSEAIEDLIKIEDEREIIVLGTLLSKGSSKIEELQKITGFKNLPEILSSLMLKGAVTVTEKLSERFHAKKINYLRLALPPTSQSVTEFFERVKGAPNQERMLQSLIGLCQRKQKKGETEEISRKELLETTGIGASALDSLIKKGIVVQFKKEINRFKNEGESESTLPRLTTFQEAALNCTINLFKEKNIVLLRGVTSSGKTEIYQHLINKVLEDKGQCLFLVPEIALTTQLTSRLQSVFGNKVVIYHSKFSDNERVGIWLEMLKKKESCVIIGARSAVFLPFSNLKLVIVDEEHEGSYKQVDPAPRYNGRDVAIVLASMHGAKVLLGSATPSIETFWKAKNGRFGYVELLKRYNDVPLPPIELVDMTAAYKKKTVAGAFSLAALRDIKLSLDNDKQAIVFQNRRGYAPVARCRMCAWSPKCNRCDVALTYHKGIDSLVCHYCGNVYPMPSECPQCKEPAVEISGYGTERIEEEVTLRIPDVRIARLDLDSTRNKDSYARIIDDFSAKKANLLVGTQMVTKGLDFGDVEKVVVVNADSMINYPDFRANERAFNMLEQVAGRAGRKDVAGNKVIFQTFDPSQRLFGYLKNHDYEGFYNYEVLQREKYNYPPFSRIINIYLKHRDKIALRKLVDKYAEVLRMSLENRVLGPDEPTVAKIQNLYIMRIMIKIEPDASLKKLKDYLREVNSYMAAEKYLNNAVIYYDVDPA